VNQKYIGSDESGMTPRYCWSPWCAKLIDHLLKAARIKETWQHVAKQLSDAARAGDIRDLEVSLWVVMTLERLEWQRK
jgi:hypothetical protein